MVIVKLKLFISHELFSFSRKKKRGEGDALLLSNQRDNLNMRQKHGKNKQGQAAILELKQTRKFAVFSVRQDSKQGPKQTMQNSKTSYCNNNNILFSYASWCSQQSILK